MVPSPTTVAPSPWRIRGHHAAPLLATAILAMIATGCQTPQTNPYATTVAPPATGMAGQPAPYGYNAAVPQGAGYPSSAPMPGPTMPAPAMTSQVPPAAGTTPPPSLPPATQAQMPPAAQPQSSSWSWAQTSNTPPPQSWQQAGTQVQQNLTQQGQQLPTQMQAQANQYQQQLAGQAQQYSNQAQQSANATVNNYQNQMNAQWQQANQQMQNGMQQMAPPATQPPPAQPGQPVMQQSQYPPQASTNSWWPFGDPNQFPPARATPTAPPKY